MKNAALSEKLSEHLPDLEIAIEENFGGKNILCQHFKFRMMRFQNDPESKPYYKLIITPMVDEETTAFEVYKQMNDDNMDDIIDDLNKE